MPTTSKSFFEMADNMLGIEKTTIDLGDIEQLWLSNQEQINTFYGGSNPFTKGKPLNHKRYDDLVDSGVI